MNWLATVFDFLRYFFYIVGGVVFLIILVYVLTKVGFAAYFKAKTEAYKNYNRNKSKHDKR